MGSQLATRRDTDIDAEMRRPLDVSDLHTLKSCNEELNRTTTLYDASRKEDIPVGLMTIQQIKEFQSALNTSKGWIDVKRSVMSEIERRRKEKTTGSKPKRTVIETESVEEVSVPLFVANLSSVSIDHIVERASEIAPASSMSEPISLLPKSKRVSSQKKKKTKKKKTKKSNAKKTNIARSEPTRNGTNVSVQKTGYGARQARASAPTVNIDRAFLSPSFREQKETIDEKLRSLRNVFEASSSIETLDVTDTTSSTSPASNDRRTDDIRERLRRRGEEIRRRRQRDKQFAAAKSANYAEDIFQRLIAATQKQSAVIRYRNGGRSMLSPYTPSIEKSEKLRIEAEIAAKVSHAAEAERKRKSAAEVKRKLLKKIREREIRKNAEAEIAKMKSDATSTLPTAPALHRQKTFTPKTAAEATKDESTSSVVAKDSPKDDEKATSPTSKNTQVKRSRSSKAGSVVSLRGSLNLRSSVSAKDMKKLQESKKLVDKALKEKREMREAELRAKRVRELDDFVRKTYDMFGAIDVDSSNSIEEDELKNVIRRFASKKNGKKKKTPQKEKGPPPTCPPPSALAVPAIQRMSSTEQYLSGKSRGRRASMLSKMIFAKADADYSHNVDFSEFAEFFVTMIHALFTSLDSKMEDTLDFAAFKVMMLLLYGDDFTLKMHEKKYSKEAISKIIDHRLSKMLRHFDLNVNTKAIRRDQCMFFVFSRTEHTLASILTTFDKHEAVSRPVVWNAARGHALDDIRKVAARCEALYPGDSDD